MKTSAQWWNEVKSNNAKLEAWLKDQYHGEVTAASRIAELAKNVGDEQLRTVLNVIAEQEATHAQWVAGLLTTRGLEPQVLAKEERYWSKTLPENYAAMPIEKIAAIGAHAEAMRLERITVIANDQEAPEDIRSVFASIYRDEVFHERAFRNMAGEANMAVAIDAHKEGLAALGLLA